MAIIIFNPLYSGGLWLPVTATPEPVPVQKVVPPFVPGAGAAHLEQSSQDLAQHLLAHDYHISVGIEREQQVETIAQLIKAAEHKMYDQKRAFYATRERRMHVA